MSKADNAHYSRCRRQKDSCYNFLIPYNFMGWIGIGLFICHPKGTFNHLKYCMGPDTATLRVINPPQIMINAEHDYNVRNSSLSTYSTEGMQYRTYFNRLACITAICSYYATSRHAKPFLSYHCTLQNTVYYQLLHRKDCTGKIHMDKIIRVGL